MYFVVPTAGFRMNFFKICYLLFLTFSFLPGVDPSNLQSSEKADPIPSTESVSFPIPDYKGWTARNFDYWAENVLKGKWQNAKTGEFQALCLWQATGNEKYRDIGVQIFENRMQTAVTLKGKLGLARALLEVFDLFGSYDIAVSADILQKNSLLKPEWKKLLHDGYLAIHEAGTKGDSEGYFRHGNRELGRIAGPVYAAFQLFKEDPLYEVVRHDTLQWWEKMNQIGMIDESSGNYSNISLLEIIRIAKTIGRESDFKASDRWKNNFKIYRDLVSPSGQVPEWGDDYFGQGGSSKWLYVFEYAGTLFKDPGYAWAARKLFQRQSQYFNLQANLSSRLLGPPPDLLDLSLIDRGIMPSETGSLLNYRFNNSEKKFPFALVLRPDLLSGSPMIMMDLYGLGDHSHMDKRGSILYYEDDDVPLFHGFNRHWGRDPGTGGNNFYLQQEEENFPANSWKEGIWSTVRIPIDRLSDGSNNLKVASEFYAFIKFDQQRVNLDNYRLEGPGGTMIIDDFNHQDSFYSAQKKVASYVADDHQGMMLEIKGQGSFKLKDYGTQIDPNKYKVLAYDVLWKNGERPDLSWRYSNDSPNQYNAWHDAFPSPFYTEVEGAETEMNGKDSYARVRFSGYGTWDSRLTRKIVLTKEGALVIQDRFLAGKSADQWAAGETWQMYSAGVKGENWFSSELSELEVPERGNGPLNKRGVLVYFQKVEGDSFGLKENRWGGRKEYKKVTAFSKFRIKPGQEYKRTVLIIPYGESDLPEIISKNISILETEQGVVLKYLWNQKIYTVTLGTENEWSVSREVNPPSQ